MAKKRKSKRVGHRQPRPNKQTLQLTRADLLAILKKVERGTRLEGLERVNLLSILSKVINEMDPKVDRRVQPRVWHLATFVAALVDQRSVPVKAAVFAVIKTFAPSKKDDAAYADDIAKHYRKLRRNQTPPNLFLAPVPPETVETIAKAL